MNTSLTEPPSIGQLTLDESSTPLESLSMAALTRELNLQEKPSWFLVKVMNALEKQRQKKGLGWSRAWNKYGLTVFRTHLIRTEQDAEYLEQSNQIIRQLASSADETYRDFAESLLSDPKRMIFTFYHNSTSESGEQYEGLTLSIGRRVPEDPSKRDRIDLILEDRRIDGRVDGKVDRARLYICPWARYGSDRSYYLRTLSDSPELEAATLQEHYKISVDNYNAWKADESRQWSHWSVRYIDYFGPREFIPRGSSFL